MPTVRADFMLLGVTLAIGAVLGFLRDCWQVLLVEAGPTRSSHARRPGPQLLFWLCAAGATWMVLMISETGQVRGFTFIGLAVGALLYALVLSGFSRKAMRSARRAVARLLSRALDIAAAIVLWPVHLAIRILGAVASFLTAILALPGRLILAAVDGLAAFGVSVLRAALSAVRRPRTPE